MKGNYGNKSSCGVHKNKAKRRPLAGNPKLGILNPKQDGWGEIPQFGGFVQVEMEIMKRLGVKKTEFALSSQTLYVKKG